MNRNPRNIPIPALALMLAVVSAASLRASDPEGRSYEVSVTNLTRGQILSPLVVATHSGDLEPLFVPGQEASGELAMVAEDALLDPLVALLESDPRVGEIRILMGEGGPILPGETARIRLRARGRFSHLSLAGMLVTTNDAFVALNGARGPSRGSSAHLLPAYDAGSEANNEDCAFIPGPPCGSVGVRDQAEAEGYVHVHAGIHGLADLIPAEHDWRNPAVRVLITRSRGEEED